MANPRKVNRKHPSKLWGHVETIAIFIVFVVCNAVSYLISPVPSCMMFLPSVLVLYLQELTSGAYLVSAFLACVAYLGVNSMEGFLVMLVYIMLYGVSWWLWTCSLKPIPGVLTVKSLSCETPDLNQRNQKGGWSENVLTLIDPEPILLLLMHIIITASMLYDPTTTFAFIVVVVAAVVTFADCDLPAERVVVFVISVTVPAIFGKVTAIVACVLITLAISVFKLRPLQPQTVSLLGLGSLALTLVFNKIVGSVLVFLFMAVVTGLFVVNKEHEEAYRRNRAQHIRHVTIITGDGQDSNLIKPTVVNFLKINKYKFETPSDTTGLVKVDLDSHSF